MPIGIRIIKLLGNLICDITYFNFNLKCFETNNRRTVCIGVGNCIKNYTIPLGIKIHFERKWFSSFIELCYSHIDLLLLFK